MRRSADWETIESGCHESSAVKNKTFRLSSGFLIISVWTFSQTEKNIGRIFLCNHSVHDVYKKTARTPAIIIFAQCRFVAIIINHRSAIAPPFLYTTWSGRRSVSILLRSRDIADSGKRSSARTPTHSNIRTREYCRDTGKVIAPCTGGPDALIVNVTTLDRPTL